MEFIRDASIIPPYELIMKTKNGTPLYYMHNEECYYTTDKDDVYHSLSEDENNIETDPIGANFAVTVQISLFEKEFKEITQEDLDKLLYIENFL